MKKIVYVLIIVAVVLGGALLFQSESRKSIFTEKLGDMTLARYETGEAAAKQISVMYGLKDIPFAKGYSAVYRNGKGSMWIYVVEAPDHNIANDAFNMMNSMLGGSTGHEEHEFSGDVGQTDTHKGHENPDNANFTTPVKVDIMELVKPDVYMMNANNVYNYYYLKMDYRMGRVYWIIFNSPDRDYQLEMVKQAILLI
ncbi:MAG TPA: hypothetical protein VIO58_10605 [Candidatus Methanoperedens sp.]